MKWIGGSLIENSIWRRPPFSYDPKKEDQEKGFRDSIILEAIISYCNSETDKKVVFVCNDKLLRETSEERLKSDKTFSAFESLDDFEAYLRLEKENLEQFFIKSIINKASKKFFKYKDENSLVYTIDLMGVINEKFSDKFKKPQSLITDDFEGGFYADGNWKPLSGGLYTMEGRPQFQSIEGDNTFHWVSKVSFSQDYEGEFEWENGTYSFVHKMFFDVFWKVNISVNERFKKINFLDVKLTDLKFTPTND
jgi:hypothetical protein